jgi:glycine dehydrogenase subunit 1
MIHRVGHTREEEKDMLRRIGVESFEQLMGQIPRDQQYRQALDLPQPLSEAELRRRFETISRKNYDPPVTPSFLGAGLSDHDRPAVVGHLVRRSEFMTAYTPYQPEVSQGTLAAIFEFQTTISELTGLPVANASLYDGGSACAEALLMALGVTRRKRVLVSEGLNPLWRRVVETYLDSPGIVVERVPLRDGRIDAADMRERFAEDVAAVLVQHPNVFGLMEDTEALGDLVGPSRAHLVAAVDPVSLGILKPPGAWGATTAVGEAQSLAIAPTSGGPLVGFMSARKDLVRRMPGRLVSEARDKNGQRGFVLTLQTREQHIRRGKATSNICTNNSLIAVASAMTLSLLGPQGLREMAELSLRKAWRARRRLLEIPGVESPFDGPFFREFLLSLPRDAEDVVREIYEREGILAGVPGRRLWPDKPQWLLTAVTEKRTSEEVEQLARALEEVLAP